MTMTNDWTFNIDEENVGRLTFDLQGEKVNKFTAESLTQLEEIIDQQLGREAIKALVIRSGKPDSFIVGADINELAALEDEADATAKAKAGKAVFARLAALRIPTVAVIHGVCLGGGLEMALACRYRLVSDHAKTSIGQPEVNLGTPPRSWPARNVGGTPSKSRLPPALPVNR